MAVPLAPGQYLIGTGGSYIDPTTVNVLCQLLNIGSTNLLKFNDNIGLEINFNIGFHSSFAFVPKTYSGGATGNQTTMQMGVVVNPNIKFRVKAFAVGLDFSFMHGGVGQIFESNQNVQVYPYDTNYMLFGISIGGKF